MPKGFQGKKKLLILGWMVLNRGNNNLNTSSKEALFQFYLMAWCIHNFFSYNCKNKIVYSISVNSFCGKFSFWKVNMWKFSYSFRILAIFYFTNLIVADGKYWRGETIEGRKLLAKIRYTSCHQEALFQFSLTGWRIYNFIFMITYKIIAH